MGRYTRGGEFDISGIINTIGETVTLTDVLTGRTVNDQGDITAEGSTTYTFTAVVDVMTGTEDLVKEGFLSMEDLVLYIDDSASNTAKLLNGNKVTWGTVNYKIVNVIENMGHYEVHCKKI